MTYRTREQDIKTAHLFQGFFRVQAFLVELGLSLNLPGKTTTRNTKQKKYRPSYHIDGPEVIGSLIVAGICGTATVSVGRPVVEVVGLAAILRACELNLLEKAYDLLPLLLAMYALPASLSCS